MKKLFKDCLNLISKNPDSLAHLNFIDYSRKETLVLCEVAIKKNPSLLQYVPEEFQIEKLCLIAVRKNAWDSILFVKQQTPKICLEAMRQDSDVYNFISICPHPNPQETIKNLENMLKVSNNQNLIKSTLNKISK